MGLDLRPRVRDALVVKWAAVGLLTVALAGGGFLFTRSDGGGGEVGITGELYRQFDPSPVSWGYYEVPARWCRDLSQEEVSVTDGSGEVLATGRTGVARVTKLDYIVEAGEFAIGCSVAFVIDEVPLDTLYGFTWGNDVPGKRSEEVIVTRQELERDDFHVRLLESMNPEYLIFRD